MAHVMVTEEDVAAAGRGQMKFLPGADGEMYILWNDGRSLRLTPTQEKSKMEKEVSNREGGAPGTPR